MKKTRITMSRRQILKTGVFAGAGMMLPWSFNRKAYAHMLSYGLSDPALQPKFVDVESAFRQVSSWPRVKAHVH